MPKSEDEIMEQIAMLLRKAERTEHPEEAKTFVSAAEAKMVRLGIDRARVEAIARAEGRPVSEEEIVVHRMVFTGGTCLLEARFHVWIANAFDLRTIIHSRYLRGRTDPKYRSISIFGHKSDVERAVRIIASLRVQVDAATLAWEREDEEVELLKLLGRGRGVPALRRHFFLGFASEAAERIRQSRTRQVDEVIAEAAAEAATSGGNAAATAAITGTALVLADRKAAVDEYVAKKHPDLKKIRAPRVNWSAYSAGQAAGRRANTGEPAIGGTRSLGR